MGTNEGIRRGTGFISNTGEYTGILSGERISSILIKCQALGSGKVGVVHLDSAITISFRDNAEKYDSMIGKTDNNGLSTAQGGDDIFDFAKQIVLIARVTIRDVAIITR